MLTKIWFINALMAFFVVFFGFKAYGVWVQGNKGFDIPEMAQKPAQGIPKPEGTLHKRKIPPESRYEVLMSLNLFAPQRTENIPEEAKPDKESKKLSATEQKNMKQYFSNLTLYGLVITNDSAEALVSHPVAKPVLKGRKTTIPKNTRRNIKRLTVKQTQWVKAGDTLGDFKVVSIKSDRVVLKAGEQLYDLLLYDKEKLKKRGPAKPKTGPNVVGVTLQPKAPNGNGKKAIVPPTDKKGIAIKALSGIAPPSSQKNLKKAIEKKQAR